MKRLVLSAIVLGTVALGVAVAHPTQVAAAVPTPQQAVCQWFAAVHVPVPAPFAAVFGCGPQC